MPEKQTGTPWFPDSFKPWIVSFILVGGAGAGGTAIGANVQDVGPRLDKIETRLSAIQSDLGEHGVEIKGHSEELEKREGRISALETAREDDHELLQAVFNEVTKMNRALGRIEGRMAIEEND